MNSSIYGSRSIIPNNYYFTFDAIYEYESDAYEHKEDILIGRCVLATKTNTVLLRIVSGYLRVAKLDNEGRFIYSEGMTVDGSFNIDNPSSNGNTIHGIGTYLVPFNIASEKRRQDTGKKIAYSTLTDEDWENGFLKPASQGYFQTVDTSKDNSKTYYIKNNDKYEQFLGDSFSENTTYYEKEAAINEVIGTWPIIKGCTQEQYLKDNEFVLEFFADSINISEFAYITNTSTSIKQRWKDANNNLLIFDKISTDSNLSQIQTNLAILNKQITSTPRAEVGITVNTKNNNEYILDVKNWPLTEASFNCFQILRNFSIDKKDISITNLNHFDKTFIRHGTITYKILTQKNYDSVISQIDKIYEFNSASGGFVEVSNQSNIKESLSNTEYRYFYREIEWKENWQDTSEQYTGYLGYLNPYSEGNKLPSNTTYSPAKYPFSKENIYFTKNSSSNKYNQVTNITETIFNNTLTDFFKVQSGDTFDENKQYYIKFGTDYSKVTNLTSFLPNIQYYYKGSIPISETYYVKNNSNNNNTTNSITLVEAINKLDKIIGSKTRLMYLNSDDHNTSSQVNIITKGSLSSNLSDDYRYYYLPESNITDAIVHHDADIGFIERFDSKSGNTYNFHFDRGQTRVNPNGFQVITKSNKYYNPNAVPLDDDDNIIKARWHINSLSGAIRLLDNMIGGYKRLGTSSSVDNHDEIGWNITGSGGNGDKRPYNISETNIIDAIVHHDADIGEIETQLDGTDESYNLQFVKGENGKNPHLQDTERAEIYSLTDAIQKIDRILGSQGKLANSNEIPKNRIVEQNQVDDSQDLRKTSTGRKTKRDERTYKIAESNIIDTLVEQAADIGELEDLTLQQTYNFDYSEDKEHHSTHLTPDDIEPSQVWSITEVIRKLDNIIGSQKRLKQNQKQVQLSPGSEVNGQKANSITGVDSDGEIIDERPYKIEESNIIDAIVKIAADIGTELNTTANLKNIEYINTNDYNVGSSYTSNNEGKGSARSLADAIAILDNWLGDIRGFGDNDIGGNFYNVKTVEDAIETLNNLLGTISSLDTTNGVPRTSLVQAINKLNVFTIGAKSGITEGDLNGSTKTISELINQIGKILGRKNNISSSNSELDSTSDLTTLINKIGKIIGSRNLISTSPNNINNTQSLFQMINALDSALGNVNYQQFDNKEGLASVVKEIYDKYIDYAKYINNLAENMNFTQMQVTALTAQLSGLTGGADTTQLTWKQLPN